MTITSKLAVVAFGAGLAASGDGSAYAKWRAAAAAHPNTADSAADGQPVVSIP